MGSVIAYCHIGSQRRRVPTHVRIGRPGSEGGVGGAGPIPMKMRSSPWPNTLIVTMMIKISGLYLKKKLDAKEI